MFNPFTHELTADERQRAVHPPTWRERWQGFWIPAVFVICPIVIVVGFVSWLVGLRALLNSLLGLLGL